MDTDDAIHGVYLGESSDSDPEDMSTFIGRILYNK
jgi:hypothetical protein